MLNTKENILKDQTIVGPYWKGGSRGLMVRESDT